MAPTSLLARVSAELGFTTLRRSSKDVYLLLLTRYLRMFAYGSSTLILALLFAALGHTDTRIGLFMTLTLVGDVGISLAMTFVADSIGRRNILVVGGLLMTLSGVVFASLSNYWILLAAAIVGVISPSGNEIGPFRAIEESTLAQLSDAETRSDIFAWYVVIGSLGTATGSFTCGWLTESLINGGWTTVNAYQLIFWIYAIVGLLKAGISWTLSAKCEVQPPPTAEEDEPFIANGQASSSKAQSNPPPKKKIGFSQISARSRKILVKLCALFFFDSLGSGMVPNSLVAFYMERKFEMPQGQLGSIMSAAQFTSSIGNIFASAVAKRIGLVRAMVFTHLPSSVFLAMVPAPSSLIITVTLLVLRASLASMDQAPRSAFLSAVVLPEERTATMGIVNTVRTMSQSSGPLITGVLAGGGRFWIAFVAAGVFKGSYDLGMLAMFVNLKLEGDKGGQQVKKPADAVELQQQYELEDSEDEAQGNDTNARGKAP